MGNSKLHYSKQERLYYFIQKADYQMVRQLIRKNPDLISSEITKDSKHTALMRASFKGDFSMIKLLIEQGADINKRNIKGETALITAVKRNHIEIVQFYIQKGADVNTESLIHLTVIDYALLAGFYQIAFLIFPLLKVKELKTPYQYYEIGKKYSYRYVNYQMMLEGLLNSKQPEKMGNYLKKEKKKLQDPVVDPRQTWKQWVKRVADFRDAPLVQRNMLPENLQPQNRLAGKIHHYVYNFTSLHNSQKAILYPLNKPQSEIRKITPETQNQLGYEMKNLQTQNQSQP